MPVHAFLVGCRLPSLSLNCLSLPSILSPSLFPSRQEAKRFQNIDKNYMKIVANAIETRNIVGVCCGNELMKSLLPHLMEQLELCQKSLSAYLETKRAEFPRFYFVSDPTLLEILSLGSDPQAVTPHFQSGLFDSLTQVEFDKANKTQILAMFSQQGEKVRGSEETEPYGDEWRIYAYKRIRQSASFSSKIHVEVVSLRSLAVYFPLSRPHIFYVFLFSSNKNNNHIIFTPPARR